MQCAIVPRSSAPASTPSASRKPAASSRSAPGVRMMTAKGRPCRRTSSGSSVAARSVSADPRAVARADHGHRPERVVAHAWFLSASSRGCGSRYTWPSRQGTPTCLTTRPKSGFLVRTHRHHSTERPKVSTRNASRIHCSRPHRSIVELPSMPETALRSTSPPPSTSRKWTTRSTRRARKSASATTSRARRRRSRSTPTDKTLTLLDRRRDEDERALGNRADAPRPPRRADQELQEPGVGAGRRRRACAASSRSSRAFRSRPRGRS